MLGEGAKMFGGAAAEPSAETFVVDHEIPAMHAAFAAADTAALPLCEPVMGGTRDICGPHYDAPVLTPTPRQHSAAVTVSHAQPLPVIPER